MLTKQAVNQKQEFGSQERVMSTNSGNIVEDYFFGFSGDNLFSSAEELGESTVQGHVHEIAKELPVISQSPRNTVRPKKILSKKENLHNQQICALYANLRNPVAFFDVLTDFDGEASEYVVTNVNPSFETTFKVNQDDIIGSCDRAVLNSNKINYLDIFKIVNQNESNYLVKSYFPKLRRHFELNVFELDDNKFGIIFTDITNQIDMEVEFQASKKFNRDIIDFSPIGILYLSVTGKILYANPMIFKMLESPDGNISSPSINRLYELPSLRNSLDSGSIISRLTDGESIHLEEIEYLTMKGSKKWMNIYGTPRYGSSGDVIGAVLMCADVSQYVDLQAQFRQSQKMDAVGRLASGVAHDFNNLLTVIAGNAEIALMSIDQDNLIKENLKEIEQAARSSADLTRQLLTFSRKQKTEPRVLNLNSIISNMDKMLRRIIRANVDLLTVPEDGLKNVKVDPGQIEQVLVNLAVNARDAMPEGGKLSIETANITLDEEYARTHANVPPGEYVMLAVSDTGCGMSEEIKVKAFDPFFTTKETGKGTGLGLSTVYGIIKQSGGHIWVYSEPNDGTSFKIYLPIAKEDTEDDDTTIKSTELLSGMESILIVEDDDSLREMAMDLLQACGYKLCGAANGEEALRIVDELDESVELLLTDLVMPGMNGKKLADKMVVKNPEMKVIYMSGYTANAVAHQGLMKSDMPYLQKPFHLANLTQLVRKVLDSEI